MSNASTPAAEEAELMRLVGSGDAHAYRKLVDANAKKVFNFCYRILGNQAEAEDATQETFLRVWNGADKWTPKAKVITWIYRIAQNHCVDRIRKRRESLDEGIEDAPTSQRPSLLLGRKRAAEAVQTALDELAPRQRIAVTLVHFQGLTNIEAAAALDVEVDALESLLARGRKRLREMLSPMDPTTGDDDD